MYANADSSRFLHNDGLDGQCLTGSSCTMTGRWVISDRVGSSFWAVQGGAASGTSPAERGWQSWSGSTRVSEPSILVSPGVAIIENRCVAHGHDSRLVGMTLNEVFEAVNIPLDANLLNQQFVAAAEAGGGWVQYEWRLGAGPSFQKMAYIFKFHRGGIDYYGGVGFNHVKAPTEPFLAQGRNNQGERVHCTQRYGTYCAETNSLSILGQGLSDLIMGEPSGRACPSFCSRNFSDFVSCPSFE